MILLCLLHLAYIQHCDFSCFIIDFVLSTPVVETYTHTCIKQIYIYVPFINWMSNWTYNNIVIHNIDDIDHLINSFFAFIFIQHLLDNITICHRLLLNDSVISSIHSCKISYKMKRTLLDTIFLFYWKIVVNSLIGNCSGIFTYIKAIYIFLFSQLLKRILEIVLHLQELYLFFMWTK